MYNSGYFSSPQAGQQKMPRTANVLQTLMQGNTGECPQMHLIDRIAQNPVVLQVSQQNQIYRHGDMQSMTVPSDLGMINMRAQGGHQFSKQMDIQQQILQPRILQYRSPEEQTFWHHF